MSQSKSLPNNLGATLLIYLGVVMAPVGIGLLVLVSGFALLKEADGRKAYPALNRWLLRFQ